MKDEADTISVCTECSMVFTPIERLSDGEWGHICKSRSHLCRPRCESYLEVYSKVRKD